MDASGRREVRALHYIHLFFHIDISTRTTRLMQLDRERCRGAQMAAKAATAT